MRKDLFFAKAGPNGTSYADFRFSARFDACVIRIGDAPIELATGREDVDWKVSERVAALREQGYTPVDKPTLPGVQTPAVIAAITGLTAPPRYARFLADGAHPGGTVDGITNFADGIPIVFHDPFIPFMLKRYGREANAPNAIPIALVEENRTLSIDANTGEIYVYDDSASKPHVKVCKDLDALLANVTTPRAKPARAAKPKKKANPKKVAKAKKPAKPKTRKRGR